MRCITSVLCPRTHTRTNCDIKIDGISTANYQSRQDGCMTGLPGAKTKRGLNVDRYLNVLANWICVILVYAILYTLLPAEMRPGGQLFSLCTLILAAFVIGKAVEIIKLPPLFGMLIAGIVLRNAGLYNVTGGVYQEISSVIVDVGVTTILISSGLGIDPKALKKWGVAVFGLAFAPCIAEAIGVAIGSFYLLDFPLPWGLALGFALGAASPAVTVPALLELRKDGYGEAKGIATVIFAACSIDDVLAISAFGVCCSVALNIKGSNIGLKLVQGPAEAVVGLLIGTVWGLLIGHLPYNDEKTLPVRRAFLVGGAGLALVLVSHRVGYPGVGPLVSITAAFVAQIYWNRQNQSVDHTSVENVFSDLWNILEPALFGMTGATFDLSQLKSEIFLEGIGVLGGGTVLRVISCSLVLIAFTELNWKEVVFVNVAWLSKATVQVALASVMLDSVLRMQHFTDQQVEFGRECLTIIVISILIAAPISAIGIRLLGHRCLSNEGSKTNSVESLQREQQINAVGSEKV